VSVGRSGELLVGPDSAGADPGPACYGKGATAPTITDAALVMGVLAPDRFLGGRIPLDRARAVTAFESLNTSLPFGQRVHQAWMIGLNNVADGVADLAIRRGLDARDHSLIAFGAAGPMLLPGLLDVLPLASVIVPPNPGGFSAAGLLSADRVFSENKTLYGILTPELLPRIAATFEELEAGLLARADLGLANVAITRSFDGRLFGQSWDTPFIPIPAGQLDEDSLAVMVEAFHEEYERRNGNRFEWLPVEGVTYRVQIVIDSDKVEYPPLAARQGELRPSGQVVLQHLGGGDLDALTYERDALAPGDVIAGPAIIGEETSTTFVPPGRTATVGTYGEFHII
jgi:N-methylhydantoinase A